MRVAPRRLFANKVRSTVRSSLARRGKVKFQERHPKKNPRENKEGIKMFNQTLSFLLPEDKNAQTNILPDFFEWTVEVRDIL